MDVNVTSWGEVEITAETTIAIDLDDVLNEVSVEKLIDALDYNGTDWVGPLVEKSGAEAVLEEVGEEDLRRYIAENGLGFVDPVLDDFSTQELIDELNTRDSIHEMLMCVDSDIIQEHMEKHRGGFTLENVPVDDLIGALEAVNALPGVKVPAEVGQAFKIASDFINGSYFDIHNGQLAGKRFIIE